MLRLWKGRGAYKCFFAPDDGSGSGAGASGGSGDTVVTPFDDIALDELDEPTRAAITKGKAEFIATLQRATKLDADLLHTQGLAKRFQSEADRNKAEFEKVSGRGKGPDGDPVLDGIRADLKASGYADADVDKMAPTFLRMFTTFGGSLKASIGKDLTPLAGTVLAQEATTAFQNAQQSHDPLGMLQVPDVAEKTWGLVQERIKAGQQTTPEVVSNLAKMAYMDYASEKASKGEVIELRTSTQPTKPAGGGVNTNFTFPGASNIRPTIPSNTSVNTPRNALNEDTQAALAQTFNELGKGTGVYPKGFPAGSLKQGGRK